MKYFLSIILLMMGADLAHADNPSIQNAQNCEVVLGAETKILLAANNTAVVSQGPTSIQFAPGYRYRTINRGGRKIMTISSPGVSKGQGTVECNCNQSGSPTTAGNCLPTVSGNTVICKAAASGCTTCVPSLTMIPPAPPNPTN